MRIKVIARFPIGGSIPRFVIAALGTVLTLSSSEIGAATPIGTRLAESRLRVTSPLPWPAAVATPWRPPRGVQPLHTERRSPGTSSMAPAGNSTADIPVTGCYSWAELAPDRAPVESWGHSMIYDPVRDRIVSFGGYIEGVTLSARVVALNLGGTPGWTDITPAGSGPIPRAESAAVYDSNRDRLVVIGGYGETGSLNDVWALDFATNSWSQLFPSGTPPAPRVSHSAIYDGTRDRIVVYGR